MSNVYHFADFVELGEDNPQIIDHNDRIHKLSMTEGVNADQNKSNKIWIRDNAPTRPHAD